LISEAVWRKEAAAAVQEKDLVQAVLKAAQRKAVLVAGAKAQAHQVAGPAPPETHLAAGEQTPRHRNKAQAP